MTMAAMRCPRAEVDAALVVAQEAAGRLAVRVEDADLLVADLRKLPVRGVVPGPEGAIGEARGLRDGLERQVDAVGLAAATDDELLHPVDDAREGGPGDGHALDRRLGLDAEGALRKRRVFAQHDGWPRPAVAPVDAGVRLPQATCRVPLAVASLEDDGTFDGQVRGCHVPPPMAEEWSYRPTPRPRPGPTGRDRPRRGPRGSRRGSPA